MVCEITLAAGSVVPAHDHPHEQCGYLVSGRLAFTIGEQTHLLEAGDGWLIPGGTTHSVEAPVESVAIDVFSPVRDEYR
ncbi:MAG: cupin domain-containing protein [Chloroflexi bacterium]|nr:cupin domain-containing protein [Chloroflexota bacterium]